jgi:hypothetical protein
MEFYQEPSPEMNTLYWRLKNLGVDLANAKKDVS